MVILMVQYNVRPEKAAEYAAWAEANVPVALSVPGLVEIKAYSNITESGKVVCPSSTSARCPWPNPQFQLDPHASQVGRGANR